MMTLQSRMMFTGSLGMATWATILLVFTFSVETAAESGTITIAGCRLQPFSPPPTIADGQRCQWYLDQITACGRVNSERSASAIEAYTRKVTELGCNGPTSSQIRSTQGTPTSTQSTAQNNAGCVEIDGCRYHPLSPAPGVSDKCRWYADQISACRGKTPMSINGVSVNPGETYRQKASELRCTVDTDAAQPGPATSSSGQCRMMCRIRIYRNLLRALENVQTLLRSERLHGWL